jgi:serine/threonine protein kinase
MLQAKICDFGLSKYSSRSMTQASSPAAQAYTPEYTSPERLRSHRRSREDDVYAFGILLYFIATSRSPFTDIGAGELKEAILDGERPDIQRWAAVSSRHGGAATGKVVAAFCALAQECWQRDPARRPRCGAILSRLTELQHDRI